MPEHLRQRGLDVWKHWREKCARLFSAASHFLCLLGAGKDATKAKAAAAAKAVKKGSFKKSRTPRYSVVFHRPKTLKRTRDPKFARIRCDAKPLSRGAARRCSLRKPSNSAATRGLLIGAGFLSSGEAEPSTYFAAGWQRSAVPSCTVGRTSEASEGHWLAGLVHPAVHMVAATVWACG